MRRNNQLNYRVVRIIVCILILAVTLSGCSFIRNIGFRKGNDKQQQVDNKMALLNSYIDEYYLDEKDDENIEEYVYKGLVAGLGDPYSTYYTKKEFEDMMESTSGIYSGIGVSVSQNIETRVITLVKPFKNGPAYDAGILPGDILVKVDGKEYTDEDLTEVVSWIKGEEGTSVELTIAREGEPDFLTFTVERESVENPTVEYQMLKDKIGYIVVTEFDEITSKQFRTAMDDLEKQNMEGLIIDLRNNGGGIIDAVVDMVDRLIPKDEMIVYTKDKNGEGKEYKSEDADEYKKPLVVLVNGNSASASEIFAGAVKDYEIGTLVGTNTFGKGIVQTVFPMEDGSAIKLTVSKYYTPNGNNIHEIGIKPDVEMELPDEQKRKADLKITEDVQVKKGIEVLKKQIK